ncbi:hypothetical protein DPMN_050156 [Dreissena polymorpha]|uniref:RING-type domain-containing protein n=1 Tax=Dreissena polymorpha TaxID=45954 RepID=A0A9D4CHA0_DREPO|nr:hypothetical protein DPMN_050156 [Dreissena polymorpha]
MSLHIKQNTPGRLISFFLFQVASVLQENAAMRPLIVCTICNTRDRRVVFLPCGHLLTCEVCGQETDTCPACILDVSSRVVVNQ